jgi:hypothetical protein
MAKKTMRPEVRAAKMRNNRLPHYMPPCSVKGCDEVFFIYRHGIKKRVCRHHFENPPQEGSKKARSITSLEKTLKQLGLLT